MTIPHGLPDNVTHEGKTVDLNARPSKYPYLICRNDSDRGVTTLFKEPGINVPAVELNESGRFIWTLCDGERSYRDILSVMKTKFGDIPEERLLRDLQAFVADLVAKRFLWLCSDGERCFSPPKNSGPKPPRPLFIMGNKRSGSSLLVNLLNLHPNIYLADEADIVWILYQARNRAPTRYQCYPWDDAEGMNAVLRTCRSILHDCLHDQPQEKTITSAFYTIIKRIMGAGLREQPPYHKSRLIWMGDKKPVQHCDPALVTFLDRYFPEARYLHIVRNPRAVLASMMKASVAWKGHGPQYWTCEPETILERWAIHEEWALEAVSSAKRPVLTLRLEDLCEEPVGKMNEIFHFLQVQAPGGITKPIRDVVIADPNRKYLSFRPPISSRVGRIMEIFDYPRE